MSPSITESLKKIRTLMGVAHSSIQLETGVAEFLNVCTPVLPSLQRADQIEVLLEVAFILGEHPGDEQIWSWLRSLAKRPEPSLKDALTTTIFEVVPEDPVCDKDLMCLWSFIEDKQTRWAIAEAYAHQPEKMQPHFVRYLAGPQPSKEPNPPH